MKLRKKNHNTKWNNAKHVENTLLLCKVRILVYAFHMCKNSNQSHAHFLLLFSLSRKQNACNCSILINILWLWLQLHGYLFALLDCTWCRLYNGEQTHYYYVYYDYSPCIIHLNWINWKIASRWCDKSIFIRRPRNIYNTSSKNKFKQQKHNYE